MVLRRRGCPRTLAQIAWEVNAFSNPSRRKRKGEYRFEYEEVQTALGLLMKELILFEDRERRKYDSKTKWPSRYWFLSLLEAMALAADEDEL